MCFMNLVRFLLRCKKELLKRALFWESMFGECGPIVIDTSPLEGALFGRHRQGKEMQDCQKVIMQQQITWLMNLFFNAFAIMFLHVWFMHWLPRGVMRGAPHVVFKNCIHHVFFAVAARARIRSNGMPTVNLSGRFLIFCRGKRVRARQ